ncbi:MAG TPA: carbohydrate porin [Sedimentisphaerales bacterium]|nr:carbohydrate porin [Sedimentisphaerales bacterium]
MNRARIMSGIVVSLSVAGIVCAYQPDPEKSDGVAGVWQQETLTGGFWGLNDQLADKGIELALSTTQIYQQNVRGGTSTHRRAGRLSGSYDLELSADLRKLAGVPAARLYMLTEGSFSNGIDEASVGSFFGVNGDAAGERSMDITELWFEKAFADQTLYVRIGKLDLTGGFEHHGCPVSFDCIRYANDENTQFLNSALVNNPAIPFPDNGLGVAVHYSPQHLWYVSAAVADAQADIRETGLATTFHDEDYLFWIFETGLTPHLNSANGPLQGAYRLGLWYDPQDKEEFVTGKTRRDDKGFYLSFDQMLYKENSDAEDTQGLGVFGRYGWAGSKVNEVTNFWSLGVQYQGLLPDRDDDVLALGFAQGIFSNRAVDFTEDYEAVWELYYSAQVTPWLAVSPSIQYVANPGGDRTVGDAVVLGLRALISF